MATKTKDFTDEGFDALDALLDAELEAGIHHGSVTLVARHGEIVYFTARGSSDVTVGRETTTDDVFPLMSVSKSYTAALVLRLVERGTIEFDTLAADVIPEFGVKGKQDITVADLLTHRGGTWSSFAPPAPFTMADTLDLEKMVAAVSAQPVATVPGERVAYNPFASYIILGEIVRRLDSGGRGFNQIAADEIFAPLAMTDSSFGLAVDAPRRVPIRMVDRSAGAATAEVMESLNRLMDEHSVHPAGLAFGTARDVFRFAEALRSGGTLDGYRLLSRATVEHAYRNHTGDLPNDFWYFSRRDRNIRDFPANFSYGGGYARGTGDHLTPLGRFASPLSFGAVGSGSTMWMVDPVRDVTLVYLGVGLTEGLHHFQRLQRISDVALAAVA